MNKGFRGNLGRIVWVLLVIMLTLSLVVACSSNEQPKEQSTSGDAKSTEPAKQKKISMGTATPAGAWFSIGGGMANAISKHSNFEVTAEVSAAAVENFRNLDAGNIEIAMSQPDTAWYYYTGTGDYQGKPHPELRALWSMFTSINFFIVPADSKITKMTDLKGKKVAVGGPGSGNEMFVRALLKSHGMSYDDIDEQFITSAQMMTALKDNQVDAILPTLNHPNSSISDLALTTAIKIISYDQQDMDKFLKENPGYFATVVKAKSYKGQDSDVLQPAFRGIVFSNEQLLSEQEAYEIVKAMWENRNEWKDVHVQCGEIALDQEFQGWPIPLHPGAYKYYQEKGLKIPDNLVPPKK